jgi:uncharacterized protein YdaU (DUF1376 family)
MGRPWFAWYPGDYIRDTAHLSMMEDGAYRRLLDHYYSTGRPLPADNEKLFRICRAFTPAEQQAVGSVLQQFFRLENGTVLVNSRVERELAKQAEYREKLPRGAQKTNQKRWGSPSASPSDSPSHRVPQNPPPSIPDVFDFSLQKKGKSEISGRFGGRRGYNPAVGDAIDWRKFCAAKKQIELKLANGAWMSPEQMLQEQCVIAGISTNRALELEERMLQSNSESGASSCTETKTMGASA